MSNLRYAWTNNKSVSDNKVKPFMDYLNVNRGYLLPIGDFVFDTLSLRSDITFRGCLSCRKYQGYNCCRDNSESMTRENAEMLKSKAGEILRVIPNNASVMRAYYDYGVLTRDNSTTTRGNEDGYCIFSYFDGDKNKCAIDEWCLRENEEKERYKPYICSLFPLEGIKLPNGKTVVYCCNKDTRAFSLYFHTLTKMICIDKDNMARVYSGCVGGNKYLKSIDDGIVRDLGMMESMKPVYIEQESILRFLCGNDVYDRLINYMS